MQLVCCICTVRLHDNGGNIFINGIFGKQNPKQIVSGPLPVLVNVNRENRTLRKQSGSMFKKDGYDEDSCCHNSPCIIHYLAIPDGKSFDAPSQCLPSIQEAEIGTFADVYEKISLLSRRPRCF